METDNQLLNSKLNELQEVIKKLKAYTNKTSTQFESVNNKVSLDNLYESEHINKDKSDNRVEKYTAYLNVNLNPTKINQLNRLKMSAKNNLIENKTQLEEKKEEIKEKEELSISKRLHDKLFFNACSNYSSGSYSNNDSIISMTNPHIIDDSYEEEDNEDKLAKIDKSTDHIKYHRHNHSHSNISDNSLINNDHNDLSFYDGNLSEDKSANDRELNDVSDCESDYVPTGYIPITKNNDKEFSNNNKSPYNSALNKSSDSQYSFKTESDCCDFEGNIGRDNFKNDFGTIDKLSNYYMSNDAI